MDNETNKPDSGLMRRIRLRWEKELEQSAVEANSFWQLKLFGETEEDYIRKEVEKKLYIPQLPNGGDRERAVVEHLKKMARKKDFADSWHAALLIQKWLRVLPENPRNAGYYYTCAPLTERTCKDYKWFTERLAEAKKAKDWDKKRFYEIVLNGPAEPCADFKIECQFLLRGPDGEIQRLVSLRNVVGETVGPVNLDSEAFHAPQKFRKWCLAHGNFNWGAGEKELQKLHADIGRIAAWRVVDQVVTLGWYQLGERRLPDGNVECDGIWFMGDCARANYRHPKEGTVQDEWLKLGEKEDTGIYKHWSYNFETGEMEERGYMLSDTGWEGTIKVPFYQNKPLLNPAQRITELPLQLSPCRELNFEGTLDSRKDAKAQSGELISDKDREEKLLCVFFRELCQRVYNAVGGEEAKLMIGSYLSYAAAPEIYAQHSLFPGLWVHGQANSGKSTICELLMNLWGFHLHSGMMLKGTLVSSVGLAQANSQYSNLPVWADEYENNVVDNDKMSILHAGFNRQAPAKFNTSGFRRTLRTNFIVSGVSTSSDAALRSRYPHIQMSANARLPKVVPGDDDCQANMKEQEANFRWLQDHQKYFHLFGRYVIEHRREFVAQVQTFMETWSKEQIDARLRIMHGVGYASWVAIASLLGSHSAEEIARFKKYMVGHSQRAHEDVQVEHNINVFIEDLVTACKMGAIPWTCFRVQAKHLEHAPNQPEQNRVWLSEPLAKFHGINFPNENNAGWAAGWFEYVLLMEPDPTIAALNAWLVTKQRRTLPLKRTDLRDQFGRSEFWYQPEIDPKTNRPKKLNSRFYNERGRLRSDTPMAWGIRADKHPMGYQELPSDEWEAVTEMNDPRKGPLFSLIEWVIDEQRRAEKGTE
ncbi:MAG: hypothetical protein KGL39_41670 [Patescibacteria group bacterium]|nr:hypothetical protein [Patescibacteria group bacterium]